MSKTKLTASPNFKNKKRNVEGKRYNFHSMSNDVKDELKKSFFDDTDSVVSDNSLDIVSDKSNKNIINLFPTNLNKDISLDNFVEAPEEWNYFPLPDTETLKLMAKSIYSQGQLSPAIVWEREDNKYMILGGRTRLLLLRLLSEMFPKEKDRFSTMNCHVYGKDQIDDNTAQYIIVMNNMTQRAKEAPSIQIKSIARAFNLQKSLTKQYWGKYSEHSNERVARSFGMSHATVDRLYRLRTLIPEFINMLDNNELSKGLALNLSSLDNNLQKLIFDNKYYETMSNDKIKQLPNINGIDELNRLLKSPQQFSFVGNKTYIDKEVPRQFEKFSLAVDKSDYDLFIKLLKITVNENKDKFTNPESVDILSRILDR